MIDTCLREKLVRMDKSSFKGAGKDIKPVAIELALAKYRLEGVLPKLTSVKC